MPQRITGSSNAACYFAYWYDIMICLFSRIVLESGVAVSYLLGVAMRVPHGLTRHTAYPMGYRISDNTMATGCSWFQVNLDDTPQGPRHGLSNGLSHALPRGRPHGLPPWTCGVDHEAVELFLLACGRWANP